MKKYCKTTTNIIKRVVCAGAIAASVIIPVASTAGAVEVQAATSVKVTGIQNNGYNGIKININAAPYTTFAKIKGVGDYAYGKSGCAWFASSRVKQVTGKGTTIWGGPSWYNTQYKNYGFTRGSVPRAKSLACFQGHVAYVESVSGDSMVISEGGSWYYSDASHGYCVIRKTNIKKYESGMGSKFLGYVYLDGKTSTAKENIKSTSETKTTSASGSSTKSTSATTTKKTTTTNKNVSKWVWDNKAGKFFYFGADGKKYTGWHYMGAAEGEKNPHWSYFGNDGYLRTGWQKMGTKTNPDEGDPEHWSYFGSDGWLRTGWQKMGTKENPDGNAKEHWSYFGPNGWLRTNLQKMGTKENPDGNDPVHYSYFGTDGWLVTNKKVVINGKTYTFNSIGWKI